MTKQETQEAPTQLERFLTGRQSEGRVVGTEGSFTLSKGEARQKLADFQLPFEYAWAVKVVQCSVADGSGKPIRIDLVGKEAHFFFATQSIALDELENAYYNPEPQKNRALNHLLQALWTVALKHGWAFQFSPPESPECLIWNGEKMFRVDNEERHDCTYLSVSLSKSEGTVGWLKDLTTTGKTHSEFFKTMADWCFTCPVPLTVNGERLDSFFNCPTHGFGESTVPLYSRYLNDIVPEFGIPRGTFRLATIVNRLRRESRGSGWSVEKATLDLAERTKSLETCGASYLLSAHWSFQSSRHGKFATPRTSSSHVFWIQDGVAIHNEEISLPPGHCAIALFRSADGLSTDLTTFQVQPSAEKTRRVAEGVRAVMNDLEEPDSLKVIELIRRNEKRGTYGYKFAGGVLALVCLPAIALEPFMGVGGLLVGAVLIAYRPESEVPELEKAIQTLKENLKAMDTPVASPTGEAS